jgi:endonuclease YncB( thermonuclease family)
MKILDKLFNKNVVTVLIVVVMALLVAVLAVDSYFFLKSPVKDSIISNLFPTRTLNLQQLVTRAALTAEANATPTPEPTITTMYFTPQVTAETPSVKSPLPSQAAPTLIPPTRTSTQAAPITSTPATQAATAAPVPGSGGMACIPSNPSQAGKVLDIVDGNTIKVLMDGLVYTVRYIGVAVPSDPTYARAAAFENGKLVFTKNVTLFPDVTNKDAAGRLLRYVRLGDVFVNMEMIAKGLGSAVDAPPNSTCAQTLNAAEQAAHANQLGQWSPAGAVPTP